eukprot:s299_g12.t3
MYPGMALNSTSTVLEFHAVADLCKGQEVFVSYGDSYFDEDYEGHRRSELLHVEAPAVQGDKKTQQLLECQRALARAFEGVDFQRELRERAVARAADGRSVLFCDGLRIAAVRERGFGYARGMAGARAMEQDLLEAALSKDVDSEIVRNNAYLGVLLHKYACNSAVLRRSPLNVLEVEAIGTAGYEQKLQRLISEGRFIHPLDGDRPSFADLAHALARCCGLVPEQPVRAAKAEELAAAIGKARRHIVVVLCDGIGVSTLHQHLAADSFLRRNNTRQLRAVFPATTPAALTTLATAAWPGQHGLPGWELRDQKGCEFPGAAGVGPIQLTILDQVVRDMRTRKPVSDLGFDATDIYIRKPWVAQGESSRRMKFVNAYNGTEFTNWYQDKHCSSVMNIPETALETLGQPEGSQKAVEFFNAGVDAVISSVTESEEEGWQSYVYLYTAHPDKHMHQLGVEHPEVTAVMTGIDKGLSRLWEHLRKLDATLIVTADHGHVTVKPEEMVVLPDDLLNCLEYANVGVHGKGRHAYFHCRSGRLQEFQRLWDTYEALRENFLLLPVDVAVELGLFGPDPPLPEVRPRLGDFLGISCGAHTIVKPSEATQFRDRAQGSHGSMTREEMEIPFLLCSPSSSN